MLLNTFRILSCLFISSGFRLFIFKFPLVVFLCVCVGGSGRSIVVVVVEVIDDWCMCFLLYDHDED